MNIFYAINHEWFIENERKVFEANGHHVYIPQMGQISIYTDRTLVNHMWMKKELIDKLERYRYGEEVLCREAISLINEHFDLVIMDYNRYLLQGCLLFCDIKMVMRPVGYFRRDTLLQKVIDDIGFWAVRLMERKWEQFRINVFMLERSRFIDKYYIGYPLYVQEYKETKGKEGKVLAIFNEVKTNERVNEKYQEFCKEFTDIPHVAAGKQLIPIYNNKELRNIDADAKFSEIIRQYKVLYYAPIEEEFPSYVFEAIAAGIPVVCKKEGILEIFSDIKFPGVCESLKECKRLCKKLCADDEYARLFVRKQYAFVEDIDQHNRTCEQEITEFCEEKNKNVMTKRIKKMGIVIPGKYSEEIADFSVMLAGAIAKGAALCGTELEVILAYMDHKSNKNQVCFREFCKTGQFVRTFKWEKIQDSRADILFQIQGYFGLKTQPSYIVANDSMNSFEDCDAILYMSDQLPGNLYAPQPYAVFINHYAKRYVPQIRHDALEKYGMENARIAAINFTIGKSVQREAVQYAGIEKSRVRILPWIFEIVEHNTSSSAAKRYGKYFVWLIDIYDNYKFIIQTLSMYYEKGGSLTCVVLAKDIQRSETKNYVKMIRKMIKDSHIRNKHIRICKDMPKKEFGDILQNAKFVLFSGYSDHYGSKVAFQSAMLGVPMLSGGCDTVKELSDRMGLRTVFYDHSNQEQLQKLLFQEEKCVNESMAESCFHLEKYTVQNNNQCINLYKAVHNYLPI